MGKILSSSIVLLIFVVSGCCPAEKSQPKPAPKPAPAMVEKPKPVASPQGACGPYAVSRSYPGGVTGVVQLDKTMPRQVQLNAPFEYSIKVTNLTDVMIADVVVTENVASNFKFAGAKPEAKQDGNKLMWRFESLDARAVKEIVVSGSATSIECLTNCATATYVIPACASVEVVQAKLTLVKTAPAEVLLCDNIPIRLVVTNSGTGVAENVKITDTLPAGLKTADGRNELVVDAGTLTAGQSRQFAAVLKATKTGKYTNKASANSTNGLKAESAEVTTTVKQPVLAISKTGPTKLYIGANVVYEITVTNKGDAPAVGLTIEDGVPAGTRFVSASDQGRLATGKVVWNLGTLEPTASRKVTLTLTPEGASSVTNTARATATCADAVNASATTSVEGIAAILLEMVDLVDPVPVNGETTYVITVTNQGSAADKNVKIVCMLEDSEQYVSSSGATAGTLQDSTITFAPVPSLAPKAVVRWRVVVKAVKAGDVRFKTQLTSDMLQRPVEKTESTHLYE